MNILILGPQGSGKGTQARLLSEKFGLFYFESGEFLREIAKKDSRIDEMVNKIGVLVPDIQMFEMATEYLESSVPQRDQILFEGYPRSLPQYLMVKKWLSEKDKSIDCAFSLEIREEESIRRLSARRTDLVTGKIYNLITEPPPATLNKERLIQRDDDKPDAIKTRLSVYRESTLPLISQLEQDGVLSRINGDRPIETIFNEIVKEVERKQHE